MSAIKLQGNAGGTGTLTVAAPSTNTNQTLTLPDNTGTLLSTASTFGGTGPAFSAYLNAAYNITSTTFTKIKLDVERFDTNNNFDTTTYRFTPTVAGYYWIETTIADSGATTPTRLINAIYKNGTQYGVFAQDQLTGYVATGGKLIYFNGSTDYVELYGYIVAGVAEVSGAEMHGYLARAA